MAQYGLTILRLRGKEPEDREFITNDFMRTFKKGSKPQSDPAAYPEIGAIRQTFDAVHRNALKELDAYDEEDLHEEIPEPFAVTDFCDGCWGNSRFASRARGMGCFSVVYPGRA